MNILHISPDFNYSCGVSRHVHLLFEELNKKSEIRLFFLTNGGDSLERLRGLNVNVDYLDLERGNKNPIKLLLNYFSLLNYCKSNKIDLIHTHHRYPEFHSYLVGKRLGIKTITTAHSLVKGWKYFSFNSDRIIAVSKAVESLLIEKYNVNRRKISHIYNFVKPLAHVSAGEEQSLKQALGIKPTDRVILFTGRISHIKGCDVLIAAFEDLIDDNPSLKLIMIGSFESKDLKNSVLKNSNIIYIEPTSEIEKYYSISDLVVVPSIIESFGYVMLESGLAGKPFIGGNTGGIGEFIEDGIDGLLVKPGDKAHLKEKILNLLDDYNLSGKLADNLQGKVSKLTDPESYITQLIGIYGDKLINPFGSLIVNKFEVNDIVSTSTEFSQELLLTYFNQHCFNIWYENIEYRKILREKFSYYLDGCGIWAAIKLFKKVKIKRFNASEVNEELFGEFCRRQFPVIMIGGRFSQSILDSKPLIIEGYINGYEELQNLDEIIDRINNCTSTIVIIGLGVPLQEKLAYNISQRIPGLQILCVGNYLEFYYGTIKRAPKIFHNSGFEWLFRLIVEPKRLWRRYILGIPIFIIRLMLMKNKKDV